MKYMKIMGLALLVCTVTGCAKAPETKVENGISYAESEVEQQIDELLGTPDKEYDMLKETSEGCRCEGTLGSGDNKLVLDFCVDNPEQKQCNRISVQALQEPIAQEKIEEILFDGEKAVDITEKEPEEEKVSGDEVPVNEENFSSEYRMVLENQQGTKVFSRSTDSSFYYENTPLLEKYNEIAGESGNETFDYDIEPNFTCGMAEQQAKEVLRSLCNIEIETKSVKALYNGSEGYYEISFTVSESGIPVASNDYLVGAEHVVQVQGNIWIGREGIACITGDNMLWKETETSAQTCISLEKALELLEKYVEEGKLSGGDNMVLDKCELAYLPVTEDLQTVELLPVWRFYISTEQMIQMLEGENYPANAAKDISINAVDGSLTYLQ